MTHRKYSSLLRFVMSAAITLLSLTAILFSQTIPRYNYQVDLNRVKNDRIEVTLNAEEFAAEQLIYHFPNVVPGTYTESNFGRFIHQLHAFDSEGKKLPCKKDGKNSYIISDAMNLQTIRYEVSDTWDMFFGRIRVFPMEGTSFEKDNYFVINTFAVFGYFEDHTQNPVEVHFNKPANFYGVSALPQFSVNDTEVSFKAEDYHHLADCPIMFAPPDTVNFSVRNLDVLIGTHHEIQNKQYSDQVYQAIHPSIKAIGTFLDSLPADNYAFIYYISDARQLGRIMDARFFKIPRAIGYLLTHRIPVGGALEHNNSTFGYVLDPGKGYEKLAMDQISGISVHEFFHIITPLNLRSQYIDDFDYIDPVMSKHLWLYEGCTEYFAKLVAVREDLITPKEFLLKKMRRKIIRGENFPNENMSFTEMSSNVLEKGYRKQFMQVYQRGAVIAMLLDIEIIRLTNGEKTLMDVIYELLQTYDKDHPFDEDTFIAEFVSLVHPDLQSFFSNYVEGREELPYRRIFNAVGVDYHESIEESRPLYPIRENKIKYRHVNMGEKIEIRKTKKDEFIGFQKGDQLDRDIFYQYFQDEKGNYLPEGSNIRLPLIRNGENINIPVTITYSEKESKHRINIMADMTPDQKRLFNVWLGIKE